jgi:hypothetical protein
MSIRWPLIRRSRVTAMLKFWEESTAKHHAVEDALHKQIALAYTEAAASELDRESLRQQLDAASREQAVIRGMLDKVPVYDGMSGAPLTMLISGLVNDHSELETRIDTVIMEIRGALEGVPEESIYYESLTKIAGYLRGAPRFPDPEPGE